MSGLSNLEEAFALMQIAAKKAAARAVPTSTTANAHGQLLTMPMEITLMISEHLNRRDLANFRAADPKFYDELFRSWFSGATYHLVLDAAGIEEFEAFSQTIGATRTTTVKVASRYLDREYTRVRRPLIGGPCHTDMRRLSNDRRGYLTKHLAPSQEVVDRFKTAIQSR